MIRKTHPADFRIPITNIHDFKRIIPEMLENKEKKKHGPKKTVDSPRIDSRPIQDYSAGDQV